MTESAEEPRALERARFVDRFVAFSIDYVLLLLAGYGVLYMVFDARQPAPQAEAMILRFWLVGWMAAFLAYHAWFSAAGRATIGKRILGLQVFTQDGYPLTLKTAAGRSLGYLLSSVLFGLGFLWALFSSRSLAWHDSVSGTMVLEQKPRAGAARLAVWAAALLFLFVDGGLVLWPVAAQSYADMKHRANAEAALQAVASFEETHRRNSGTYTNDLGALGRVYGDPREFTALLGKSLDLRSLRIEAGRDRFTIRAAALDEPGTEFQVTGPPPQQPAP